MRAVEIANLRVKDVLSADNEVFVNKAYREMPKMVGMMGS